MRKRRRKERVLLRAVVGIERRGELAFVDAQHVERALRRPARAGGDVQHHQRIVGGARCVDERIGRRRFGDVGERIVLGPSARARKLGQSGRRPACLAGVRLRGRAVGIGLNAGGDERAQPVARGARGRLRVRG